MSTPSDVSCASERTVPGPGTPIVVPAKRRRGLPVETPRWQRRFTALVVLGDLATIAICTTMAVLVGVTGAEAADRARVGSGLVAAALLVTALPMSRAWDGRVLGVGAAEFLRLGRAVVMADVALALGGLALMVHSSREWVFALVPGISVAVLVVRFGLRKALHRQRGRGRGLAPVLAVGDAGCVADLIRRTRRDPHFGWSVASVCTPTGTGPGGASDVDGVPVVGDLDAVTMLVREGGHRVVAICRSPGWGPARLHRLAWALEGSATELAVDPGLMEIAGPRMHISPVDGLPLLRLSEPRFTGASKIVKYVADRMVAGLLVLAATPLLLAVAIAVKLGDGGPVLFRQERVGTNGRRFGMLKFRTMCPDAEAQLAALTNDHADGPMFKMARDPRITRVGSVLRRYSLDELPQLLNVLGGSMSLVGPRPPLPHEVATYADDARRRLLVKPGMTGLWQVSGRSTLTWEESVRLDLRYVENWTPALDLLILWKTIGAVLRSRGAY
ncbi:sugar transferase [Pseudonocardia sp. TMWB2A]|uniref:sugar transferase n=1 Tax=Pseudonocardia sp. TMWB2A TaxID=687430 RepID=UPI00307EE1C6